MQQDTSYINIIGYCVSYDVNYQNESDLLDDIVYDLLSPQQNNKRILLRATQQNKNSVNKMFNIYKTLRERLVGVSVIINKCDTQKGQNYMKKCIEIIFIKQPSQQEKQMNGFEHPFISGDIITYDKYLELYKQEKIILSIKKHYKEEENIASQLFQQRFINGKKDKQLEQKLWQKLENLVLQVNPHKNKIENESKGFTCNYKTVQKVLRKLPKDQYQKENTSNYINQNILQKVQNNQNDETDLEQDLARGLLFKTLRDKGHQVQLTDEKIKETTGQLFQSQLALTGQYDNCQFLQFKIEDSPNLSFNQIMQNEREKKKFLEKFIQTASQQHGVSPDKITITNIKKGSIEVDYTVNQQNSDDQNNCRKDQFQKAFGQKANLILKSLLDGFEISKDYFNPQHNMYWDEYHNDIEDYRGSLPRYGSDQLEPERYYFPVGYYGYGINVQKWLEKDSSWFGTSSSEDVWIVLYHGTSDQGVKGISKSYIKPGYRNVYGGDKCRLTGEIIQNGEYENTYLSNKIEVAEDFSDGCCLENEYYYLIFQCRVEPNKVRSPKDEETYYTVHNDYAQSSIRPYRLLVKKKNQSQSNLG